MQNAKNMLVELEEDLIYHFQILKRRKKRNFLRPLGCQLMVSLVNLTVIEDMVGTFKQLCNLHN